jgi:putative copper resistance protein D
VSLETALSAALSACMAVHAGSLMAWFGALALARVLDLAPEAGAQRRLHGWAALALASGVIWPLLQTAAAFEDPAAALDPARIGIVLGQTSFGRVWLAREALIAIAFASGFFDATGRRALLFCGAALAGLGMIGHAAGASGLQEAVVGTHLLAAGAWLGALPLLWSGARRLPVPELTRGLQRFSVYGLVLVAIVVTTGTLSAWWRLGSIAALTGSGYGRILLVKVTLVALMGVAALRNRNVYVPRLERDGMRAGIVRSIAMETALGAAVVICAGFLGSAEAPA